MLPGPIRCIGGTGNAIGTIIGNRGGAQGTGDGGRDEEGVLAQRPACPKSSSESSDMTSAQARRGLLLYDRHGPAGRTSCDVGDPPGDAGPHGADRAGETGNSSGRRSSGEWPRGRGLHSRTRPRLPACRNGMK